MSLVHESLISVLRRRFVSTYYNAFSGGSRYGLIATPDGEAIVSFGFQRDEFFRALKTAMKKHPELTQATRSEQAALAAAEAQPLQPEAHLGAAQIKSELLDYAGARLHLERVIQGEAPTVLKNLAFYLKGHLAALDLEGRRPAACRAAFAKMSPVPASLLDDVALDLMSLDVRLKPVRGFFPGWEFIPGSDVKAHAASLERLMASSADGNRIGQMHFFLGLARFAQGDKAGADRIWKTHVETYPRDRFAMLSHIHHSGYEFSPSKQGPTGSAGGVMSTGDLKGNPAMIRMLLKAIENGTAHIQGTAGAGNKEMMKAMLERMLKEAEQAQPETADEEK